jgi:hypothetical protein
MTTPRCPSPRTSPRSRPLRAAMPALLAVSAALAAGAAFADPVPGQGTWESTLSSRDINGDGTVDAWYDSTRNVTWLADARAVRGTSFDDGINTSDGRVTYASAASWLAGLDVYGVTGWRFAGDDLIAVYGTTLGNSSIPMSPTTGWTNTGPFLNVPDFGVSGWYWRGDTPAELDGNPGLDTRILAADGLGAPFYIVPVTATYGVWAVVDGDVPVAAIPEPQTWALMLAGLAGLGWRARSSIRIHVPPVGGNR